jgi:hypothetical protein
MDDPSPTQSPKLSTLPNELLTTVFKQLDTSSLLSLTLINRHIHAITIDIIYTTFNGNNPAKFLRTLASLPSRERSRRAGQVKSVTWNRTPAQSIWLRVITLKEWRVISAAFRGLGVIAPEGEDIAQADSPVKLTQHSFFEFLLLFFPKLEKLEVTDECQWEESEYWFTNITPNVHLFSRLRQITMLGPLRLENVVPLLRLPALDTLDVMEVFSSSSKERYAESIEYSPPMHIFDDRKPSMWDALRNISSGLEHLILRDSYLDSKKLGAVLGVLPALKSLHYEHFYTHFAEEEVDTDEPWYEQLATALSSHNGTLEFLRIHTQDSMFANQLCSLTTALPSLKSLDAGPFQLIYTFDEDLELYCDKFQGVLLEDLQTFKVHLRRPPDTQVLTQRFVDRFAKAFAAAVGGTGVGEVGVEFEDGAGTRVVHGELVEVPMALDMRTMLEVEMERFGIRLMD